MKRILNLITQKKDGRKLFQNINHHNNLSKYLKNSEHFTSLQRFRLYLRTLCRTIESKKEVIMTTLTVSEARAKLYRLIDEVSESHKPVFIKGKRSNGILISEDDWNSIQETIFLLSIPNMRESIKEGMETPAEECSEKLDW
jgi:PHD/YefM family antitoxin component YafN of YafNO toxin-antitoxin module